MAPHLRLVPSPGATDEQSKARKTPVLNHEQRLLVKSALPMVERCATEIAHRYRKVVTREELLAPGTFALHDAAAIYQEEKHPDFAVFARHYIRGHMLDAIRAESFSLRARVERAMDRAFDRFASHQTQEVNLFMDSEEKVGEAARRGNDDALAAAVLAGLIEAQSLSPEELLMAVEARDAALEGLKKAIATLYRYEREVISLVYEQGLTLDEVSRKLPANLSTVKLRHVSALRKLRAFFVDEDIGPTLWPPLDDSLASTNMNSRF
ncbi:MAG: sigma-70 family RNA polymerase sigma factor [Minicystis sp.]